MRQRIWLELVKDYDCGINYHPEKANVVADVLSRKNQVELGFLLTQEKNLIREFEKMKLEVVIPPQTAESMIATLSITPDLRSRIVTAQREDEKFEKLRSKIRVEKMDGYHEAADNAIMFEGRLCVPNVEDLNNEIMSEAHDTPYVAHPGSTKIFQSTINMAPYEALYGRKCRSPLYWDEVGERKILGPEAIDEMITIVRQIRQRIKEAQDRQKSYADTRRTEIHFDVGDKVFLKVSPSRGVHRFGVKGKLKPRYIGPYDILDLRYRRVSFLEECTVSQSRPCSL
ncbi:uncharacterized protein LOC131023088 [Salvia miltiorrhiza]|uniref:uncharacterized protein LOC131023088 n=1 Tax=Salvia miltiorrhiza TaxID=226208 RepID=UPI0025ABACCD|nr:uncharacterized protein LOC131023088 [Salvia miltiorrhiza]